MFLNLVMGISAVVASVKKITQKVCTTITHSIIKMKEMGK